MQRSVPPNLRYREGGCTGKGWHRGRKHLSLLLFLTIFFFWASFVQSSCFFFFLIKSFPPLPPLKCGLMKRLLGMRVAKNPLSPPQEKEGRRRGNKKRRGKRVSLPHSLTHSDSLKKNFSTFISTLIRITYLGRWLYQLDLD